MTNSLKYAFPDNRHGKIKINLQEKTEKLTLKVSDDGIVINEKDEHEKVSSFGHKLIRALADQMKGEVVINNALGTSTEIRFSKYEIV